MSKIRKAVIPVAGFGTRFLPATIAQPKEMLPLVDKPVIQYIVEEFVAAGVEEIIFVTGRGKRAIEDHFDPSFELEYLLKEKGKKEILEEVRRISSMAKFVYVRQNKPLGNGHALLQAKEIVGDEPFAFSYGDDVIDAKGPAIKQLIDAYDKYGDMIVGVMEVSPELVSNYGIVDPSAGTEQKVFEIKQVVEKPEKSKAPSLFAGLGRYVFNPDIFAALEKTEKGKGGEIWITDAMEEIFKQRAAYACTMEGSYYDCGNKLEYLKANTVFALKNKKLKDDYQEFLKSIKV